MMKILSFFLLGFIFLSKTGNANETESQSFIHWWSKFREAPSIPPELKVMEDYFIDSGLVQNCSKFWLFLNRKNIEQIAQDGYTNFKQTVACNYFTWVVDNKHGYGKNLYAEDLSILSKIPQTELDKKHAFFTEQQSIQYNCTTALFYDYLVKNGAKPYLQLLDEPFFGNPPAISIEGKAVSQDVLNSLLEYLSITNHCDISKISSVLELGAGSGRTAHCFLKLSPKIKYIVVDIPPALFLSQTYLSEVFPEKKIFAFRPFESFEEIEAEFLSADILFMTPDQMLKLPRKTIDLFMAIDCLHEMRKDEVQLYFDEGSRLSSYFYFKCWNNTVVPFDNITYTMGTYPVPSSWNKIFEGNCFVPSDFFHAFYKLD